MIAKFDPEPDPLSKPVLDSAAKVNTTGNSALANGQRAASGEEWLEF